MEYTGLIDAMTEYYSGDPKRIQHFLKVYAFADIICQKENIPQEVRHITLTAAIVHDIGIKPAEEKYGECGGKLQEREGPPAAGKMLSRLGYEKSVAERVCYLVGHHHTYDGIDAPDYQILVEADFLVNMYEDGVSPEAVDSALKNIFRTESGKHLCRVMYGRA